MRGPNQPTRYNDITRVLPEIEKSKLTEYEQLDDEEWKKNTGFGPDPFEVSKKNGGPGKLIQTGVMGLYMTLSSHKQFL